MNPAFLAAAASFVFFSCLSPLDDALCIKIKSGAGFEIFAGTWTVTGRSPPTIKVVLAALAGALIESASRQEAIRMRRRLDVKATCII
jgi:hypothetical protein